MCECSICYDEITKATGEVKLSCSHVFHFSCISSWFFKQDKGTCPCCRKEMGEKEDFAAAAGGGAEDEDDDEDDEDDDDEDNEDDDDDEDEDVQAAAADYQENGTRAEAFKDWFGDWENDPENASKVVDENGEPFVVYHYSNAKNIEVFYPFAQG